MKIITRRYLIHEKQGQHRIVLLNVNTGASVSESQAFANASDWAARRFHTYTVTPTRLGDAPADVTIGPGSRRKIKPGSHTELASLLRGAASALQHGRHNTALRKVARVARELNMLVVLP